MHINWLLAYQALSPSLVRQIKVAEVPDSPEETMVAPGRLFKKCSQCGWVTKDDFDLWCWGGMHEYSEKVDIQQSKILDLYDSSNGVVK